MHRNCLSQCLAHRAAQTSFWGAQPVQCAPISQPCPWPRHLSSASPACSGCTQIPLVHRRPVSSVCAWRWHTCARAPCSPGGSLKPSLHSRVTLDRVPSQEVWSRESPRHGQVFKHGTVKDALKMQSEIVMPSLYSIPLCCVLRDGDGREEP